jgi:uncharacterized membrane protein YgcG
MSGLELELEDITLLMLGESDSEAEDDMGEYATASVRRVTILMIQIPDTLERTVLNYFARAMVPWRLCGGTIVMICAYLRDVTHRSDWIPTKVQCRRHNMQHSGMIGSGTPSSKVQCFSEGFWGDQKCTAEFENGAWRQKCYAYFWADSGSDKTN